MTVALMALGLVVTLLVSVAPPASAAPESREWEMFRLINVERTSRGLTALQMSPGVADSAESWAYSQATGACGSKAICHDPNNAARIAEACACTLTQWGENVGYSTDNVAYLHDLFMGSDGHRNNVLSAGTRYVGIGMVVMNGRLTATVRFFNTKDAQATISPPVPGPGAPTATVVGDFNGNGRAEVFEYRSGSGIDRLREGQSNGSLGTFVSTNPQSGSFQPFVGDFNGDGRTDVFWYSPGAGAESIWYGTTTLGRFTSGSVPNVGRTYVPKVGDFDGNAVDDILWYAPGTGSDAIWSFTTTAGRFTSRTLAVNATYEPIVGEFSGDRRDDILWYAAGAGADYIWHFTGPGTFRSTTLNIGRVYRPIAGDFDANGRDDIFWYAPGAASDSLWYFGLSSAPFTSRAQSIGGDYRPRAGDINGDRHDDIVWQAGTAAAALSLGQTADIVLRLLGL